MVGSILDRGSSGGSISLPLTPPQQAQFNNGAALLLPKWRAAVGAVKSNVRNAKILCIGDSITSGAYSAGSDWKALSWCNQLAKMLLVSGVPSYSDSFLGFSDYSKDSRLVLTAPWVPISVGTDTTIGGNYLFSTSAGTATGLSFTPLNNVDTFKFWTIQIGGAGIMAYNLNGGANSTINLNGATALVSGTITGTLGSNTINFSRSSGGNSFLVGIEAWNSAISSVQIINCGWDGSTTTNWNNKNTAYAPGQFATIGADLTIIMLGINNILPINGPLSVAVTSSDIQALITSGLTTGDVLLVCENPAVVASTQSLANQTLYWNAVKNLAVTANLAVVSIFDRWVSYEYSNPLGYYYAAAYPGNLHPTALGYSDIAQAIFNVIGNP